VIHCRLAPLRRDEVTRYIDFRLQEAGYRGKGLFVPEVVGHIAVYSAGIPRLINIICDNALLLAFAASKKKITPEMIHEAARDLGLKQSETPGLKELISIDDQLQSTDLVVSGDSGELTMPPPERQKSGSARIPIGISLALITVGGAAGGLYSQQVKGYLQKAPAPKNNTTVSANFEQNTSLIAARDQIPATVPLSERVVVTGPRTDKPRSQGDKSQPMTSKVERTEPVDRDGSTKEEKAELGTFEVGAPFSFVRATPRANAKIIATLTPPAQVKVVSMKGDYFRIQTVLEGRTIRGYVHREDAFFERISDRRQRKTRME
ncbi:MAG: hypothetical protein ACREO5_10685, partial [Candidatus Binatia bacterium]